MSCWRNLCRTILIAAGLFLASSAAHSASAATITDGGLLTGSFDNIDLSAEGPLDFIHWGDNDLEDYDRKATTLGGTTPVGLIEDWTAIGSGGTWGNFDYSSSPPRMDFTYTDAVDQDGVSSSHTNDSSGVYIYQGYIDVGFSFRVEASGDDQTLKVYIGGYDATGQLTATLPGASNFTGADLVADDETVLGIYTIHFNADQPGDFLTVDWTQTDWHGNYGQFYLNAAALVPEPSTLVLSGMGAFLLLALGAVRRMRSRKRQ